MNIIQVHPSGWGFIEKGTSQTFTPWGCNYYDPFTGWAPHLWEQFDAGRVAEQLAQIQAIGGNCIRVFTTLQNVLLGPHEVNPVGIEKMQHMLSLAEANHLRVIWSGPNLWEGAPDWWREAAPYEAYANPDLIASMQAAWRGIGAAFRDHPAVLAYELRNEPFAPWSPTPALKAQWSRWRRNQAATVPEELPDLDEPHHLHWPVDLQRFREYLAVEYVRQMTEAIRSTDDTHLITIGLHQKSAPFDWYPPDQYAAFNPHHMADYLDYTSVHFYPHHIYHPNLYHDPYESATGMQETLWHARAVCRYMTLPGKPAVLEECGWYGGGAVIVANREQSWRSEAYQATWCQGLTQATRGEVCGWLFWPYRDTPSAMDASRYSGLYNAAGKLKDWGQAFARLAPDITATIPTHQKGTYKLPASWQALVTQPGQIKTFRRRYLEAYRQGHTVDFEIL